MIASFIDTDSYMQRPATKFLGTLRGINRYYPMVDADCAFAISVERIRMKINSEEFRVRHGDEVNLNRMRKKGFFADWCRQKRVHAGSRRSSFPASR
jgi:hypothetical protein